ncbi:unnamed protein product [Cladocopium goreaui]|uniref:J domain-containing protein n=1 Tax=Cladocopium goreaui TaxID=2562237 RepID=A0A9P1C158_9DINO|nr:unnamed protein product [Cladocopium goreaui]
MGDGGAVGKGKDDDLDNAYELLALEDDAGEKEIKTAYRKISLKCHPDRNPDDEEAAEKFDRLTRAKETCCNLAAFTASRHRLVKCASTPEIILRRRKRKAARDLEELDSPDIPWSSMVFVCSTLCPVRSSMAAVAQHFHRQERHAQEDAKRRKLREDLEGRESAANARSQAYKRAQEDAEARKKYLQQDMAQRIKAKEAELAQKQQEVAASVAEARDTALDSRLRVTWRGVAPGVETIRQELAEFELISMEVGESAAIVQLGSREMALRAVLECKSKKNSMPFKVALAPKEVEEPVSQVKETPKKGEQESPAETFNRAKSFDDWEAQMMADLQNLAKKQTAA